MTRIFPAPPGLGKLDGTEGYVPGHNLFETSCHSSMVLVRKLFLIKGKMYRDFLESLGEKMIAVEF